jgi:ABC-type nitrate/sulfonate/bicarbonate transport system substrate-binding protein
MEVWLESCSLVGEFMRTACFSFCGTSAPVKVRAVYPAVDVQYLPASLAQARSFFKEEGLDVELIVMRGGTLGVQAVVGGNVDFVMQFGSVFPAIGAERISKSWLR